MLPRLVPASLAALAAPLLLLVLAGVPASAEPPVDVAGPVTDRANALSDGESNEVEAALDDYYDATGRQLFVVFVRSFDGLTGPEWADATARASGLGNADILLAVSIDERSYGYSADADDFSADDLDRVDREYVLRQHDWAGAAVAATEGLAEVTGSGVPWGWVLGGAAVLVVGGAVAVTTVRRRFDRTHHVVDEKGRPIDPADLLSDEELERRAGGALVAVDDAIQTSTQELGFAEAQFGAEATTAFAEVLREARASVQEAFALQQRLDDAEPESDAERRRLLSRVLTLCERAEAALDAQVESFDAARDLQGRAPEALAALEPVVRAAHERLPEAERQWGDLSAVHAPRVLAAVSGNVEQARALLKAVDDQLATVREALASDDRPRAAVHLRAAEDATAQVTALFDALETTRAELQAAREASDDLLGRVSSAVASVATYVETHRGAVGATARTRLSEAARLLEDGRRAGSGADADHEAARDALERADALAQQAQSAAEADVAAWRAQESGSDASAGDLLGSLVLGGIVLGRPGGSTRGPRTTRSTSRSTRTAGSFGGTRTRTRRSGGGRF